MKFAIAMILAVLAIVSAMADGTNTSVKARHRARLAAMTPEQRAARKAAAQKSKAAERAEQTRSITAKFAAAKAACGPDCYRVLCTNGVYVGMDYATYTNYVQQGSSERPIRARRAMISPGRKVRYPNAGRHRRNVNGRRNHIRRRSSGEMGY